MHLGARWLGAGRDGELGFARPGGSGAVAKRAHGL